MNIKKLNKLWNRGQELLGVEYPIMCGAMTWVSEPNLVAAVCNAGAFASLACGNMPVDVLKEQIEITRNLTDKPFAVNLITVAPNYKEHLKVVAEAKLPIVVFAGSVPRKTEIDFIKESGAKVLAFASTEALARRMMQYGVDGLILEGMEAGGHIGPISGPILWQQILFKYAGDIPIFIAGGVATGKMMGHLLLMGASGVQLGTRFVMTEECIVHDAFKESFKRAPARDAIAAPQFDSRLPVIPVRALKNAGTQEFSELQLKLLHRLNAGEIDREEAQLEVEKFWMGALRVAAIDGDIKNGSLMAGQTVGLMSDVKPVKDVIEELITEAAAELEKLKKDDIEMISPTYKEFAELSKKGNVISVYQELFTDMETPLGIYSRLADSKYSFLLESVDGGENLGRYSFIGYEPAAVFYSKGQEITVEHDDGTVENFVVEDDPVQELRRRMQIYKAVETEGLPAFTGGTVGYFSYDATKFFEEIKQENSDDLDLPEIYFIFTKSIIVFDHVKHRMLIVANAFCEGRELEEVYAGACETIKRVREKLSSPLEFVPATVMDPAALALDADYQPPSNYSPEEFEDIVERCKEYIRSGDIIQVVPSQRFEFATQATPLSVYRSLRSVNPSPYLFLLKFDDMALVGSSPEVMIKVEGQDLDLRPIAGTRPRGETIAEDLAYEKDLLADEKELAEHTMLVDLGRNDLGRVSQFNTVEIPELMVIERYSHVMHIVSDVRGKLLPGKDAFDVLKATFPAGTVSGAPKIRAMEIIEEMEKTRRGPYAGTVCYLGYDNNLNSCITIRTVVMKNGKAYIQAGAGIVADSVAEMEYKETVNKAKAMIKAIKMAELLN